jgi:deoxyadenosine/deoxycytidine kinase
MTKHTLAIAGNIGAGKSSLSALLGQALGWKVFYEAVDDNPYLDDFYRDMRGWSFHSQVFFLSRRLRDHHRMSGYGDSVIQDRSIYEDAEIFCRNLYLQGHMDARDYATYHDLYTALCEVLPPPSLVVYLRTSVPTLMERIRQRGRDYEQSIRPAYLAQLNDLYEAWIADMRLCPVLTVETDALDFVHNAAHQAQIVATLRAALGIEPGVS